MRKFPPYPVTLRQLQYVVAIADHASFHRAAAACGVSQPSLSTQVAQLEETLGVRIFERLPRRVVVTERGAALLERARKVILEADDLVATSESARDPMTGTLRVGVIPTVAPYLLPEAAPILRKAFPRLSLFWSEEKTSDLVAHLENGDLDAGIVAIESDLDDLHTQSIGRDPFVLALPKDHALAKTRGPAKTSDIDAETVLVLEDGHCFRDQALAFCARAHAEESSVRATSLSTLAQMVAGGAGITLLPTIALRTENRARSLALRSFGAKGPARTLALAWRRTSPAKKTFEALAETLQDVVTRICAGADR